MVNTHEEELILERASPGQLRKLISPASEEPVAAQALKALLQARPRDAAELAAEVLANGRFGPTVRSVAAIELGKSAQPENESVLIKAIGSSEPQVLRHVLKSIGRIGGDKALERLAKFEPPASDPVVEALNFARILLAYRAGSTRFLVRPPSGSELRPPAVETAFPLEVKACNSKRLEPMLDALSRQLPATELSLRSGLAVTCGSEYLVLLSNKAEESIFRRLERSFIAGAIFKYRPCPEHHSLDAYLLSSPREDGSSHIFGMRPSGTMVLAGKASAMDRRAVFEVTTTRSPHFRRVRLTGELAEGSKLRSLEAMVSRELADDGPRSRPQERSPFMALREASTVTDANHPVR